ncbi:MAG: T9SS type A sorting domain-containing protein [Candidatus Cloacimonetes bacterium]|nr:T9SS type A sorting domain-containing protein [Candidatus Cloacimonadota bacterium]
MRKFCYIIVILAMFAGLTGQIRKTALLDLTNHNAENHARFNALEHCLQVAGIPYIVTEDISEASQYAMIAVSGKIDLYTFSSEENQQLEDYVFNGGILVAPRISTSELYPLFGVNGYGTSRNRYEMHWNMYDNFTELRWFDDSMEQTISLGNAFYSVDVIQTRAYLVSTAMELAHFDDGGVAVTKNQWGSGWAYNFGFDVKEVVLRPQLNYDYEAQRVYSNGFEPTSDTIFLFYRGIWETHIPYATWKHTSPWSSGTTVMLTHDVDAKTGYDSLSFFTTMERDLGLTASYMITTRYFSDDLMSDYYRTRSYRLQQVLDDGHIMGSHSVGHFTDFHYENIFPIGVSGMDSTSYSPLFTNGSTQNGTVWGELEVSKNLLEYDWSVDCQAYRSGYLLFNTKQANILDSCGYLYDSTHSANDVLTNFPYKLQYDNSASSSQSPVYEIPLTISDVWDSGTEHDVILQTWQDVIDKNLANNSPVVLLIHPNRQWKADLEYQLITQAPASVRFMSLEEFGNFWSVREEFFYTPNLQNDVLELTIETSQIPIDSRLGIIVKDGQELNDIVLLDSEDAELPCSLQPWGNNDMLVCWMNGIAVDDNTKIPSAFSSIEISPNPFNPDTSVSFNLVVRTKVELSVFNIRGQLVKTLHNGNLHNGRHSFVWNGKDINGKASASGIYFFRLKSGATRITKKATLLK